MGLRASLGHPVREQDAGSFHLRRIASCEGQTLRDGDSQRMAGGKGFRCGAGAPYSTRFLARFARSKSLSRAAGTPRYTGPERLAGRLAPSVPDDAAVEA